MRLWPRLLATLLRVQPPPVFRHSGQGLSACFAWGPWGLGFRVLDSLLASLRLGMEPVTLTGIASLETRLPLSDVRVPHLDREF